MIEIFQPTFVLTGLLSTISWLVKSKIQGDLVQAELWLIYIWFVTLLLLRTNWLYMVIAMFIARIGVEGSISVLENSKLGPHMSSNKTTSEKVMKTVVYLLMFVLSYAREYSAVQTWMQSRSTRKELRNAFDKTTDRCVVFEPFIFEVHNKQNVNFSVKFINKAMKKQMSKLVARCEEMKLDSKTFHLDLQREEKIARLTLIYLKSLKLNRLQQLGNGK